MKLNELRQGSTFIKKGWKEEGIPALIARLILGAAFLYAATGKITDPSAFAELVYNYRILPDYFVNLVAVILPWLELLLGLLLIAGLFREGSVILATVLLLLFSGAMVFNLVRGLEFHCGCFSTGGKDASGASMKWYIARDALFLLPAFYLIFSLFRREN